MEKRRRLHRLYRMPADGYPLDKIKANLAASLRRYRKERYSDAHITQGEFADKLGLARQTYAAYENPNMTRLPPLDSLLDMCNKMHVSVEELLLSDADCEPPYDGISVNTPQDDIDRAMPAIARVLRPTETAEKDEKGIVVHHYAYGDLRIDHKHVSLMVRQAELEANRRLARSLREYLDQQEQNQYIAQSIREESQLAKDMGVDYEVYKPVYDRFMKLQEKSYTSFPLLFHSFSELLFIMYFTGADPMMAVKDELATVEKQYNAADVMTQGANSREFRRAAISKRNRLIGGLRRTINANLREFWDRAVKDEACNRPQLTGNPFSAVVEFNYLKILGVNTELALQIYVKEPEALHKVVRQSFLQLKIQSQLLAGHKRGEDEDSGIFSVDSKERYEQNMRRYLSLRH